ncbi:unnamed protein product [Amoebophrya sp. A120]|nr:unnamed protein product [Amoebophrya sp. A120]|eukprot:GSA120T00025737001.1
MFKLLMINHNSASLSVFFPTKRVPLLLHLPVFLATSSSPVPSEPEKSDVDEDQHHGMIRFFSTIRLLLRASVFGFCAQLQAAAAHQCGPGGSVPYPLDSNTCPVSSKTSGSERQSDLSQQPASPRDDVVSQRRRPCWSYPLDEKTCCVPSREKADDEEKDGQRAHCFDGAVVTRARCCAQTTEMSRSIGDEDALTKQEASSGLQFQDALAKAMDEQEAMPEMNIERSEDLEEQRDHGVEVNAVPEWLRAGSRPVMLNIFGKNEPNPHALQLLSLLPNDNALTETVQHGLWSAHLEMLRGVFGEILVQWNAVSLSSNTTTEDVATDTRGSSTTTSTDRTHAPPADHEQRRSEQTEEQAGDGVEEYEGRATELALQEYFFALRFLFGPKGVERTIPRGGDEMLRAVLLLTRLAKRKVAARQELTDKKLKDALGDENDDDETHPLPVATPLEYNFWTSDLKSSSRPESPRKIFTTGADDVVASDEKGRDVQSGTQLPNTREKGPTLPLDRVNPEEYERSPLFVYEKLQKCSRHFGWALVEIKFRIADFFFHHILRIKAALELVDLQRIKNGTTSGLKDPAHTPRTLLGAGTARFLRKMWASSQGPRAPVRGEDADTHVVCLPLGLLSTMTSADQDLDQRGLFAMFRLYILPLWLFWQRDMVQEKFLQWFRSFTMWLKEAEQELHIDASLRTGRASRGASTPPVTRALLQSLPGTTKRGGRKPSYSHFMARLAERDASAEDVVGQVTTTVLEFVDVRLLRMTSLRAYDLYQQALTQQWMEKQEGHHAHTKSMSPSSDDAVPPTTNASPRNDDGGGADRRITSTANDESKTNARMPPPHSNDRSASSLSVAVCISGGVRGFTQKPVYESIRDALTSLKAKKVRVFYQFDLSRVTKLGIGDQFDNRHHSSSSEQKEEQLRDRINNSEQEDLDRAMRAVEEERHGEDERNSGVISVDVQTASVEALSSSSWTATAFQQIDNDTKNKCLSDQITCPIMGLQRDFCRRSIHEYERQVENVSRGPTSVSAVNDEAETKRTDAEATGLQLSRRSEFDWVLFTRPDLFLQPLGDLRRFDPAFIHAPTNTLWGCISCKLALVPRKFLDLYVDSYRLGGDQQNAFACYPRKSETVTETFAGRRGTDCGCTLWKALRTCKAGGREQLLSKSAAPMSKDREHEQDYTWHTQKQAEATRSDFAKNQNNEPTGPAAALLSDESQTVCGNPDAIKVPKYRPPVADDAEEKELQTSASILDPPLLMPVEQAMTATVTRGGLWRPDWNANMAWFR